MERSPPAEFEEYRLVRLLGSGAMGQVYLAHDTLLDRSVAIKFIGALDASPLLRERFLVEARAIARIQHANVVSIHRVGELEGRPYLISEFIHGESLDRLAKPIHWSRALEIGIGLARGLAAAHRRGVLHRDVKPANAILSFGGDVKLVDFGLAKFVDVHHATVGSVDRRISAARSPPPISTIAWAPDGETPRADSAGNGAGPFDTAPDMHGFATTREGAILGAESVRASPEVVAPELTRAGTVMGTPYYMAPEVWAGQQATRASDVYSLGALLYELCCGRPPYGDVALAKLPLAVQLGDAKPIRETAPSVDARLAATIDRCLRRDPSRRFRSAEELSEALEELVPASANLLSMEIPEGNPYRGLNAFEAEHRALFFGRAAEVRAVLERLRNDSFVLVAGDSGVGKSSLCRAGVLPWVEQGALKQGRTWSVVSLVPGRHPVSSLQAALAPHLGIEVEGPGSILEAESLGFRLRARQRDASGLLIFIDQMEELATLSDPGEAAKVCETLARLTNMMPGVRVLATVRGDFLTRVAGFPGLGEEVTRALYLLKPLTPRSVREAVVGPAQAKGVRFESDGLVDQLIETGARAGGWLPLLQFALAELWDARDREAKVISARALEEIGGVEGALARHADDVIASLLPAQRVLARRLFMRLVSAEGTKLRLDEVELAPMSKDAQGVLDALVRGRLLIAREAGEGASYELAHEALIRSWSTLRGWLESSADLQAALERLTRAATEWARLGRPPELLWSERQLAEIQRIERTELEAREAAFVEASERRARRGRWRRRAIVVGVPLALGLVFGGVRLQAQISTSRKVAAHLASGTSALSEARARNQEVERLRMEAFGRFDVRDHEAGEALWAKAARIAMDTAQAYGEAGRMLEAAFALDPSRADVHGLLGAMLYDRALLAEREGLPLQRDEFLQRLRNYDSHGDLLRRWNAPGRIAVTTTPPGARVWIERFREDELGRRTLERMRELGLSPIAEVELEQGLYALTFAAPGRVEVRALARVTRGERAHLALDLPLVSQVPPGFVYVPKGRFLFGSAAEDELRKFFNATPLHEVETDAYLIARHETTYSEWITFLLALPKAERSRRTPQVSTGGLGGGLRLIARPPEPWALSIEPTASNVYVARWGENIVYSRRGRNVEQNWLRLPVSGVSWDDAQAYVAWLRSSKRVPGARLCTDHEWERAARGAGDDPYPHGRVVHDDDFNFDDTYGKHAPSMGPDEVGAHAASRSPFGVDDLAGNVWEWVASSLRDGEAVMRGGGYNSGRALCSTSNREPVEPTLHDMSVGIRVCADVSGP